jgi:hypothetical protein
MFDPITLRNKTQGALKKLMQNIDPMAKVVVTLSPIGKVQILIESEKFRDLEYEERDKMVWPTLDDKLGDYVTAVSVCILRAPEGQPILDNPEGDWQVMLPLHRSKNGYVFSLEVRQERKVPEKSNNYIFYMVAHNSELGYHTFKILIDKNNFTQEEARKMVTEGQILEEIKKMLNKSTKEGIPVPWPQPQNGWIAV